MLNASLTKLEEIVEATLTSRNSTAEGHAITAVSSKPNKAMCTQYVFKNLHFHLLKKHKKI